MDLVKFIPYFGDTMGITTNDNHIVVKWANPECKILFSMTRKGNGMICHLASDKKGLRKLAQATKDCIEYIENTFEWCNMIIAITEIKSIQRFLDKVGFNCSLESNGEMACIRRVIHE